MSSKKYNHQMRLSDEKDECAWESNSLNSSKLFLSESLNNQSIFSNKPEIFLPTSLAFFYGLHIIFWFAEILSSWGTSIC